MKLSLVLCFSLLLAASVHAGPIPEVEQLVYYRDVKQGWWWYQDPPREEKKEERKEEPKQGEKRRRIPVMKDYTPEQLWTMHPDDFQSLLMDFQKKAVMKLDEESTMEYLTMQDIARKRSLAYANVAAYVQQKNPALTLPEYSLATPGMAAATRMRTGEMESRIRQAESDFALLYFHSPECGFCSAQDGILRFFQDRYGWQVRSFDVNRNPNLAARFNVATTPYLILIYRKSRDYIPVSAGVVTLAEMEEKLFRGIRLLSGEITPREYSLYEHRRGGSFDVGQDR
ncbi:conjugal transfer protein TraF [bacterium]|nr:conjugal transfer protein TraF [bacterium]